MKEPLRVVMMLIAATSICLLTSCASPPVALPVSSLPSAIPASPSLLADEDVALGAAEDRFADYVAAADEAFRGGDDARVLLDEFLSEEVLQLEVEGIDRLRREGLSLQGVTVPYGMRLKESDRNAETMATYVCLDLEQVRVVNELGQDVTNPARIDRQPMEVEFALVQGRLMITKSDTWHGENFC